MKFTAILTLLCLSTSWATKEKSEKVEDPKGKREVAEGYPSQNSYQAPQLSQDDGSAVSIGAGYNIGGAKPSFSYGGQESGAALQFSPEGLPASGHATIQLAPITLQPNQGGFVSNDFSQLMSQLTQGLNSGALSLQSPSGLEGLYQVGGGQGAYGGQEYAFPQFSNYAAPKAQQYAFLEQPQGGAPSYAIGAKGLSSYTATGPVLFNPSDAQGGQRLLNAAQIAQSFSDAGAINYGESRHALGGNFGGYGVNYGAPSKSVASYAPGKTSFKPSAFLGSSVQGDSLQGFSGSHSSPSFGGAHGLSSSHGALSFGAGGHGFANSLGGYGGSPSKQIAASYLPAKSEAHGSASESLAALSAAGHSGSPPGASYGIPSGSYQATAAHAASMPQYYVTSKHSSPSSFGEGSSAYRAPSSSHSSFSSGPKYSFGGHGHGHSGASSRHSSPKDSHGAYSESTYNTIKYSEEIKPYIH